MKWIGSRSLSIKTERFFKFRMQTQTKFSKELTKRESLLNIGPKVD